MVTFATQNGGVVSGFPSTIRFTFGYVRWWHQLHKVYSGGMAVCLPFFREMWFNYCSYKQKVNGEGETLLVCWCVLCTNWGLIIAAEHLPLMSICCYRTSLHVTRFPSAYWKQWRQWRFGNETVKVWEWDSEGMGMRQWRSGKRQWRFGNEAAKVWEWDSEGLGMRQWRSGNEVMMNTRIVAWNEGEA